MAIVGVGHAIVDLFVEAEEDFLVTLGIEVGTMVLADTETTREVLDHLSVIKAISGGSAANTMVGVSSLGAEASFIGTVGDDAFGEMYVADLAAAGVEFATSQHGPMAGQTGHSVVVVTPGGQRTMLTHLGASAAVASVIDSGLEDSMAEIVYLEGYVLDSPGASPALMRLLAKQDPARRIAFSLSDRNVVERRRTEIWEMLKQGGISILLCNESEACELTGAKTAEDAAELLSGVVAEGAITLGSKGALIFSAEVRELVPAFASVVTDTTGAGDLFAAGYLVGISRGLQPYQRGLLGCICAAEVISHFGARPEVTLAELVKVNGL